MRNTMSAAEKRIPPEMYRPVHIAGALEEGGPVSVTLVREAGGVYGRHSYPLILYLDSKDPFRGYFLSPALEGESRVCFRSYAEFSQQAGELTEKVRALFRSGKRLETEAWQIPAAARRRADQVLLIRPGKAGEWSGDVYTPGIMTLETFRDRAELEKLLCP